MARTIKNIILILSLSLGFSSTTSVMPVEFEYNQSTEQAFYFIIDASIDGMPIEEGDWIAAFKGDVCVGSRQWVGSYTDIPVMGDDGEEYSAGYMLPGEYPTFKIYKFSGSNIFNAYPSQNVGFPQGLLAFFEIQSLDVVYDCADILGGPSALDNCGVCDDDPENDCNKDCMDVWGGTAFLDDCDVCSGGTSNHEPNSDKDACGVCFGSGENDQGCGCFLPPSEEYWFDEDGDGFGSGEGQEYCYADLPAYWVDNNLDPEPYCSNPDPNTLMIDHCGICEGGGIDDLGCGCYNPASLEYWYDSDVDGLGSGNSEFYCLQNVPDNWVLNNEDIEPECSTNDTDYCGVCAGGGADDLGCGCFNPATLEYWYDIDLDGFGYGDSEEFCLQDIPENWVANNVDLEEYCWNPDPVTPMIDVCGICAGGGVDDLGCGCYNPAPLEYWYDSDGDGMGFGPSQEFCLQNIPDNWVLNNDDAEPYCPTNDTDHCNVCAGGGVDDLGCGCYNPAPLEYWYDSDGDNLGFGDSIEFCLDDVLENWVSNDDDEYPNCFDNFYDGCDICGGDNSDDLGCGCFEPASLEYWYDSDGDGLGSGNSEFYCLQNIPENWVANDNDMEPDCPTNDTDHCNICAGGGIDDLGCGCYNPASLEYWYDSDGDGLGFGNSEFYCLQNIPDNWVLNNEDLEPECSTNDTDYCGVCAGEGVNDLGCGCFENAPVEYCEDTDGDGLGNGNGNSASACNSDISTWYVSPPDYQYNGSITSSVSVDGLSVAAGDQIAAYVGTEVRGIGEAAFFPPTGSWIFLTMIFSNVVNGETVEFKYHNTASGEIVCLNEAIEFQSDMTEGNGFTPILLTGTSSVGSGNGSILYCEDEVPDNWVSDCSDPEPNCTTNDTDDCNICGGGNTDMDCNGICFGDAVMDNCDVCDNNPENNCNLDCNGDWGGIAYLDNCNQCSGGNSGHLANSDIDDCGYCFGNNEANLGCGCDLLGPQNYWYDSDGDGLGAGGFELFCAGSELNGWVDNANDFEPDCSTNDTDECEICAGSGSTCAFPLNITAIGGRNEVEITWDENPEASFYNIYYFEDELIGTTSDLTFTDPSGAGFGLLYDSEYCYVITSVNNLGIEGNPSSPICATTLPYILAGLELQFDPVSGTANVYMSNLWPVLGYQFNIDFNSEYFDVVGVSGLLNPSYGNGTILGYSILGDEISANPEGVLLASIQFLPNQNNFNQSFIISLTDVIISDDDSLPLVTCGSDESNCSEILDQFDFSIDCNDDWFGTAIVDDCNQCSNGNTGHVANSDIDCNGDCFGSASIDNCNDCVQGNTGLEQNYADQGCGCYIPAPMTYCEDTDGDNFGNPGSETEFCMVDTPENWLLNCTDSEPECSTNDTDYCGVCGGGGTDDIGCGCFNPAALEYWYDLDGDGMGYGPSEEFCLQNLPDNWVLNNNDSEPECSTNDTDYCGICGGGGAEDLGCGCFNPAALEYWYDSDGDGLGYLANSDFFCLQDLPEGWVLNNDDIEPNCPTNDTDYCGICAGGGAEDVGCGCFELAPIEFCYDADGDGLGFGSYVEYCATDIPENWVNDCSDTEPFCPTNDTDDCSVCGGDNSSCTGCTNQNAWNYCIDCTIEDESCIFIPEEFNFFQSTTQAFYFVIDANISDLPLNEYEDWIGVFNGDICVGSRPWEGTFTSVPAMGDDGSEWTAGYLVNGNYPTFKIYDASENTYFETEAINIHFQEQSSLREQYNGWVNFGFFDIESLRARIPDCVNVLDGSAYIDGCGECVAGTTDFVDGWAKDCNGDCFGEAYLDNCGICSEGNSGHSAGSDNLGCGCFLAPPEDYWYDSDADGLGSGDPVSICIDDVTEIWVQNGDDLEPFCLTNDTDECGICAGNNDNMDCAGICFGTTIVDECGECGGDGTSCLAPVADTQSIELFEDIQSEIILSGYDQNNFSITEYTIVSYPLNGSITGELPTIVYTPNLNYNGEDSFQFTVSTDQFTSEPALVFITILPINDSPIAYSIQENLEEDESLEFPFIGFDIDGDELSYELISGPSFGELEINGDFGTYTPNHNYFGLDSFEFLVNDGQINSDTATAFLTINSVNDLPIIESINNQEILENESLSLDITATDEESDFLIYSATVDDYASVSVNGSELNIIPEDNYNGIIIVSVNVTDGFNVVSEEFTLTVQPVNDPPEFVIIPSQSTDEDVSIDVEITATDSDGDELTFSADESDYAIFNLDGNILTITPIQNYYGQFITDLFVSDGEYIDSTSFTVNVNSVNDPPELIFIENQSTLEDTEFNLELFASDIEDNPITFTASADGNSQILIVDDSLIVNPNEDYNGDINITIIASDGTATVSESFVLSINPVNDSPEISIINDINIDEDDSISFRIIANDIDGDSLIYSASGTGLSAEFDDDIVTIIPDENLNGVIEVSVAANDGELQATTTFNLIINEVNDAPEIVSEIQDVELNQNGEDFNIDLSEHFYDVENGNNLEYSIFENHPAIIAYVEDNYLILSVVENVIGSGFITITASDNISREVVSINFGVNVIAVNQPPIVNDMTLTTDEDSELVFTLDVSDESPELVLSILSGMLNGDITYISNLELSYLPNENYFGSDQIIFSISDGEFASELTVDINIESVNDAPYFLTSSLEDATELSEFSQLIEYEDVDDENSLVDLSLVIGPSWIGVDGDYLGGSPSSSDAGIYSIMLKLDDGNNTSSIEFDLNVINSNEAPNVSDLYVTCEEDASISFTLFASDFDGDDLSYSIGDANNGSISGTPPNLIYTPNLNFSGDDYFTFTAFDGIDSSEEGTIFINVLSMNDAPTSSDVTFEVGNSEYQFNLSDYVSDLEDDELTFASIPPSGSDTLETVFGGLIIPNGDHSFTYEHPEGISDADFLLYKVSDGLAESVISTVTFNLYGGRWSRNNPPSAFDDEVQMVEDNSSQLTLVGFDVFNEFSLDGNESVIITQQPEHGILGEINLNVESRSQTSQQIGDIYEGGYVFQINEDGTGLVADLQDFGQMNWDAAMEAAPNVTSQGYDDWYLPSIEELELMYNTIGQGGDNIGGFYNGWYWSSTELLNHPSNAWFIRFSTGNVATTSKTSGFRVRVIRSVTFDSDPGGNSSSLATWTAGYTPDSNFNGTDEIKYKVVNPNNENGDSEEGTISITVNAVNDLPIFSSIETINFDEDGNTVVEIQFLDVDNELVLDIDENEHISIQVSENNTNSAQLHVTSDDNYFGSSTISISVTEDIEDGIQISQDILVVVDPINDSPVLSNISDVSINEDESTTIQIDASDIDFVSFGFEISSSDNIYTELIGNQLTLLPSENWNGVEGFTITVEDNLGLQDNQSFSVSVLSVNDRPVANNQSHELLEDEIKLIHPSGSDIENDLLTFSISEQPENGTITLDGWIFTYEPNDDFNGEDSFTYVANDGFEISEPALVELNISPVNDAPIFSDLDDINLDEDSNIDVFLAASDIDGDLLSFSIVDTEVGLGATLIANVLSISPDNNYNGNESIVLEVSDGELQEIQTIIVNVSPINDPPIIDDIVDITINEGEGTELELSASDIDDDDLIFSASSDDDVELSVNGSVLTLLAQSDAGNSEIVISVVVSDSEYTDTETFSVFTQNLNDPPSTESLSFIINEDSQLSIAPQGNDPDGDALSFSIVSPTENGSIEFNNGLFIYNPNNNFVGTDIFTYLANDGEYDSQVSTVNIAINNVNDKPVLDFIDNQLLQEGESLELELSAEDVDADALTYSAIANGNVVVDIIGNILTISPLDQNFNGDIEIIVTVDDGQLEDSHNFVLTYTPINDSPQISEISDSEINEDAVFVYLIETSDIDGDNLFYGVDAGENAIASISNSVLTITPNQDYFGIINVTVAASDGEFSIYETFALNVLAVNDAPVIPTIETQNAFEDIEFQFDIVVNDIDDDDHSFSVTMDTTFVSYSISGNSIVVEPMENWYGEVLVNVSVSDNEFTVTQSFIIEFGSVNDFPQIISDAITDATEDLTYEYQMGIDDPDSDSFYFSLISGPVGMEISESGLITWLPTEGIVSSGLVAIVVWDTNTPIPDQDFPAYQEFTIIVESVNDAPVITSSPVLTATEDEEYSYQVIASDVDSDNFTYSFDIAPEGMTITNNGLIEWLPTEGILSSDMVRVNVSDNDETNPIISSQQFLVVVTPVNDAPIIVSMADSVATTGEEYTYQVMIEDPDDDEFTYILFNNPDEMHVNDMGLVSWIPVLPGIYGPITLAVSDGGENDVQPVQELFIVVVEVASPLISMEFEFSHEANLISFLGIPVDSTVAGIFEPLGDNAQGLIGQGTAANNLGDGSWVGSLGSIEPTSGYWLKLNYPLVEPFVIEAYPTDPYINYDLLEGQNLISYVGSNGMEISEAIPDEYENNFYGIISQGTATVQLTEGNWVGSLTQFDNLKGYWVQVYENMDFNWNVTQELVRESKSKTRIQKPIPAEFMYAQSTQQAFYFVKDIYVDDYDLLEDDWLIAYHHDTVIGARQWNGQFTDIPVMGVDGFDDTFGYIESGVIPVFKLFRASTGELIEMTAEEIAPWRNNQITFVSLTRKEEIPVRVVLNPAYPNPFNPSTKISFDIAHEGWINISIYDINGRLVAVLKNDVISVGSHSLMWNAQSYASGIYFANLTTENITLSQKLILVK